MRALHVIGSRRSGGAERFFVRLVAALRRRGCEVTAVTPPASDLNGELAAPRLHVPMRGIWDLPSRWGIARAARAAAPAVVQTYMGRATRLTHLERVAGCAHVARLGGYYDPRHYRHADAWVGNTRGICDHLLGHGFPPARVHHIGNFVEPAAPDPEARAAERRRLGVPAGAPLLLCVARLHPNKGIADLLHAFARLRERRADGGALLAVVGDGPLAAELHALGRRLGLDEALRWTGWRSDPGPCYRAADLLVCPSRHEPLGNVILEAWAHGLAVLSTRSHGALELISDGRDGVLVPCADPPALAAALERLLADPAARAELGRAGRAAVHARHGEAAVVDAYLGLYAGLLG